jgi:NAD+ kinase
MPEALTDVGLVARTDRAEALPTIEAFARALLDRGVRLRVAAECYECLPLGEPGGLDFVVRAEMVFVLGGDGTLLSVAREAAPLGTPVFGVDLGSFGFLAEERPEQVLQSLDEILAGEYLLDERLMLEASILHGGELVGRHLALNDIVVAKVTYRHLVLIHCEVDGSPLATYRADGLIIATPTGSTAYNLSAGGPIVDPRVEAMVVTAICPHTLYSRPLLIDVGTVLELWVEPKPGRVDDLQLTVDGQEGREVGADTRVVIRRAECRARLCHTRRRVFFDRLRDKLNWGAPR